LAREGNREEFVVEEFETSSALVIFDYSILGEGNDVGGEAGGGRVVLARRRTLKLGPCQASSFVVVALVCLREY
jgi:hypothetical protein